MSFPKLQTQPLADEGHFVQTRAAEDLLTITRTLKEAWLFGKLQTVGTSEAEKKTEETSTEVFEALARLKSEGHFDIEGS